jgi:hypothetical protein
VLSFVTLIVYESVREISTTKNTLYRCSKPAVDSPIRCEVAAQGSAEWAPVAVRE